MCLVLDSNSNSVEAGWGLLGYVVGSGYLSGQGWLARGGVWVEEKAGAQTPHCLFRAGKRDGSSGPLLLELQVVNDEIWKRKKWTGWHYEVKKWYCYWYSTATSIQNKTPRWSEKEDVKRV